MLHLPSRSGQPYAAVWHRQVIIQDGEQQRSTIKGQPFYCAITDAGRTSRAFRDGIQGRTITKVIASTNVDCLANIEEDLGTITLQGNKRNIAYATIDQSGIVYIGLE